MVGLCAKSSLDIIHGYDEFLKSLKERIRATQVRAACSVNRELLHLYWRIGKDILERQSQQGWGVSVIDTLAQDLNAAIPDQKGFSPRSLKYMKKFAELWSDDAFVQQPAAQLPWGHHMAMIDKLKSRDDRLWYTRAAFEHGWSRDVLIHQIDSGLVNRQGQASTNFQGLSSKNGSGLGAPLKSNVQQFQEGMTRVKVHG